ncbi:hypothetical protein EYF80_026228 [Liparis tanakae]|uniref:Uncharacterized protein n=1 Tax=Liparis tanakae TaxID=230148 RepID=A0A4Z2HCU1_9TELE|nr:hypothetical protein EYF80_026228 [Liparis tanakae]
MCSEGTNGSARGDIDSLPVDSQSKYFTAARDVGQSGRRTMAEMIPPPVYTDKNKEMKIEADWGLFLREQKLKSFLPQMV